MSRVIIASSMIRYSHRCWQSCWQEGPRHWPGCAEQQHRKCASCSQQIPHSCLWVNEADTVKINYNNFHLILLLLVTTFIMRASIHSAVNLKRSVCLYVCVFVCCVFLCVFFGGGGEGEKTKRKLQDVLHEHTHKAHTQKHKPTFSILIAN